MSSLWGEEFDIPIEETKQRAKKIIAKIDTRTDEQKLKSKKTPLEEKIKIIENNVYSILGHYKDNIMVIRDITSLHDYISKAIDTGIIAIDTETNNTLDTVSCKLMGACIYTDSQKQVYIPVNHINPTTGELLPNQLKESEIRDEFQRLIDNNTKILMHNAPFDIQVIYTTCGIFLPCYWDTFVGARMLDENERSANLKNQYISKIDPNQDKYSLEHLFNGLPYAIFSPELFAYYASTDAYMTYKLYKYQLEAFKVPEQAGMFKLFKETEMPLIPILAKMRLKGISFDNNYAERLSKKYNKIIEQYSIEAKNELKEFDSKILEWRLTPEANYKPKKKKITKDGNEFDKSKNEQLEDPINLDSPTQLAILLYDILGAPVVNKEKPRGTGVEELEAIKPKLNISLIDTIIKQRKIQKLLNTFIDKMPEVVSNIDGRIHAVFESVKTNCITGDTSVLTSKGVEFIEDIVKDCVDREYKEFEYDLINEYGDIETTSHKIMFKDVPTYKIKTMYGFELEGTPNHPIRVLNKNLSNINFYTKRDNPELLDTLWDDYNWKKLKDIQINDFVIISFKKHIYNQNYIDTNFDQTIQNKTHKKSTKMPIYFDEEFAELLGMFHADGSLKNRSGSCMLALHNEQPEVVARWKYLCEHCFDLTPVYLHQGKNEGNMISSWYINGKKLNQLYNYLHTGKSNKRIPKEILISKDSVFNAYIKGLTLDSSTYVPQNDRLRITIINKQDAQACQLRFLSQGVITSLHKSLIKDNRYEYVIQFKYDALKWFYNNVGVIQSKKILTPTFSKIHQQLYVKDGLIALPVKEITTQINTVYDFTLPQTHSFITNGFISHNTGRFSSSDPNLGQKCLEAYISNNIVKSV